MTPPTTPDAGLSRAADTLLYALGVLSDLVAGGYLTGAERKITGKGLARYAAMVAQGFRPDPAELDSAVMCTCRMSGLSDNDAALVAKLVRLHVAGELTP